MSTHADTAAKLVIGSRNADYGNPHPDFAGIALMWSGILNTKLSVHLTATDVALMMTALKLRRHAHKPKDDNLVDAHGYLLCLEWIETGKRPEPFADSLWETIEEIAIGAGLPCPTCHQKQPCLCTNKRATNFPAPPKPEPINVGCAEPIGEGAGRDTLSTAPDALHVD